MVVFFGSLSDESEPFSKSFGILGESFFSETYMLFLRFFTPAELRAMNSPHTKLKFALSLSSKGELGRECFTHNILGILYTEYGNTSVHLAFVEGLNNFSFPDVLRNAF